MKEMKTMKNLSQCIDLKESEASKVENVAAKLMWLIVIDGLVQRTNDSLRTWNRKIWTFFFPTLLCIDCKFTQNRKQYETISSQAYCLPWTFLYFTFYFLYICTFFSICIHFMHLYSTHTYTHTNPKIQCVLMLFFSALNESIIGVPCPNKLWANFQTIKSNNYFNWFHLNRCVTLFRCNWFHFHANPIVTQKQIFRTQNTKNTHTMSHVHHESNSFCEWYQINKTKQH